MRDAKDCAPDETTLPGATAGETFIIACPLDCDHEQRVTKQSRNVKQLFEIIFASSFALTFHLGGFRIMPVQFSGKRRKKLVAGINVAMHPDLKALVADAADRDNLPMSELIVKIVAKEMGRPDLATVPRKRPGRPRKDLQPA